MGMDLTIASFDAISEVNMVSSLKNKIECGTVLEINVSNQQGLEFLT